MRARDFGLLTAAAALVLDQATKLLIRSTQTSRTDKNHIILHDFPHSQPATHNSLLARHRL